jgi:hypothetical protein
MSWNIMGTELKWQKEVDFWEVALFMFLPHPDSLFCAGKCCLAISEKNLLGLDSKTESIPIKSIAQWEFTCWNASLKGMDFNPFLKSSTDRDDRRLPGSLFHNCGQLLEKARPLNDGPCPGNRQQSWWLQHACLSTPKTRLDQIDLRVW